MLQTPPSPAEKTADGDREAKEQTELHAFNAGKHEDGFDVVHSGGECAPDCQKCHVSYVKSNRESQSDTLARAMSDWQSTDKGRFISSAGTITQVFGWTAGPKRHDRRLGHINLSPQAVSHGLPVVKAVNGLFEGVEFIDQLPKTLQVAQQECDVERTQHNAADCNGPVTSDSNDVIFEQCRNVQI